MSRTYRKNHLTTKFHNNVENYYSYLVHYSICPSIWSNENSDIRENTREWFGKLNRDGKTGEGHRKASYRWYSNKHIRKKAKAKLHRVFVDTEVFDEIVFENKRDGKKYINIIW